MFSCPSLSWRVRYGALRDRQLLELMATPNFQSIDSNYYKEERGVGHARADTILDDK